MHFAVDKTNDARRLREEIILDPEVLVHRPFERTGIEWDRARRAVDECVGVRHVGVERDRAVNVGVASEKRAIIESLRGRIVARRVQRPIVVVVEHATRRRSFPRRRGAERGRLLQHDNYAGQGDQGEVQITRALQ